jgi:hypothetical protein
MKENVTVNKRRRENVRKRGKGMDDVKQHGNERM